MTTANPETIQSIATEIDSSAVADAITSMANELADLRETVEEQQDTIDDLEDQLRAERETRGEQDAEIRGRLTEVEGSVSDDADPTPDVQETPLHEPQTGLEEVIQLPEPVADDTLTANQQRARFVAKDIGDYSRSVPAGRAIKSSEIRRVLTAAGGGTVHTQTVTRVMEFLEQLGEDSVKLRESRSGERLVVFDEDLVKRIVASNTVVTEDRPTTPQTV